MPSFPYVARTPNGTLERGVVDVASIEEATAHIHAKGWTIEEIGSDSQTSFQQTPTWTTTEQHSTVTSSSPVIELETVYIPLLQTIRLFAGWLMAWYGIIYLAGTYRGDGRLPYDIPFIQSLASSSVVLRFSFAVFLFLLLSDIYGWIGKKPALGVLITLIGLATMWMFHVNV